MDTKPWGPTQWLIVLAIIFAIGVISYFISRRVGPWVPEHGIVRPDQVP